VQVELFCLSRTASRTDRGEMTLIGVTNVLAFPSFPASISGYCVAGRIRFGLTEFGAHDFLLKVEGVDRPIVSETIEVVPERGFPYAYWTFIMPFPESRVSSAGQMPLHIVMDGKTASTCVIIVARDHSAG
jgi:hypothetical protein